MDKHMGATAQRLCQGIAVTLLCGLALPAHSQLVLSTELYGAASQQREDDSNSDSLQLGNITNLGFQYLIGSHRLVTGYSFNLRETYLSDSGSDISYAGTTRYIYRPSPVVDANLGHTVRAASNEESLLLDFSDYDLRHSLTGGAGLNLTPSDRTRTRFELQATQVLDENLDSEGYQLNGRVINGLQLNPIASASLIAGRTVQWDADNTRTSTNNSLLLGYQRALPNGSASGNLGLNLYEEGDTQRSIVSAGINRNWVNETSQTSLSYNRAISDTLTELSFEITDQDPALPGADQDEPTTEVVRLQQAVLIDSIGLTHRSNGLCERCTYQLNTSVSTQSTLAGRSRTFTYTGGARLGFRLSNRASLNTHYQWRARAEALTDSLDEQQHRIHFGWDRRLTRQIQARASFEHAWETETDQSNTTARLGIRIGLIN